MFKLPHNGTHLTRYQSNAQILQIRLQQYVNRELPDIQAGIRKGRGTRDQIANIHWIIIKESSRKPSISALLTMLKSLCGSQQTVKILKEMGIPDHLTCLLINLYTGQEATVRTEHGTTDWSQIGKGVRQGCVLSPCLFNLHAEYIMQNARLDESKLESRLTGEISTTSDLQMIPLQWQKAKRD